MSALVRHPHLQRWPGIWAVGIIMVVCLLGFIVIYPKGRIQARAAAAAPLASEPVNKPTKAVKYETIRENWKRYRSRAELVSE